MKKPKNAYIVSRFTHANPHRAESVGFGAAHRAVAFAYGPDRDKTLDAVRVNQLRMGYPIGSVSRKGRLSIKPYPLL